MAEEKTNWLKGKRKWIKIQTVKKEIAAALALPAPVTETAAPAWSITERQAGCLIA